MAEIAEAKTNRSSAKRQFTRVKNNLEKAIRNSESDEFVTVLEEFDRYISLICDADTKVPEVEESWIETLQDTYDDADRECNDYLRSVSTKSDDSIKQEDESIMMKEKSGRVFQLETASLTKCIESLQLMLDDDISAIEIIEETARGENPVRKMQTSCNVNKL